MKAYPHLHLWLVPWHPGEPAGIQRVAELGNHACSPGEAELTAKELRSVLS